ncbi:MAG: heme-binding protein [Phycisphaeraceae bacterium]|nr:heme-binding protein [Phycisphaeraceae bacterium]
MSILAALAAICTSITPPHPDPVHQAESAVASVAPEPNAQPAASWTVLRVGGDLEAQTIFNNGVYTSGKARIDTPLPEGYPPPTPPGAIELKRYPIVRRAEFSSNGPADLGMNVAFWPLFKHIQRRDIEMTSPVEMDYRGLESGSPNGWTMSFLYRRVDQGPTGKDGLVTVQDAPPITVVAIGMTAPYATRNLTDGLNELNTWLASQTAWERAGDPRAMHYNGPEVRPQNRWMEVQIPVRLRTPVTLLAEDRPETKSVAPAPL